MSVSFIGWVAPRVASELIPATGPPFSAGVVARTARIHEDADFDRVLIGYFTDAPDGFLVAAHAASVTSRLGFLLAHRPGFVAPTLAARKMATLDQLCGGRLAVHLISGGNDRDQAKDGDRVDHAGRYRRTAEYATLLDRTWTATEPFSHQGEFYEVRRAHADIRCHQKPRVPLFGGGGSDAAVTLLAPLLDTFMLWGEPLAETAAMMARIRAASAASGNQIGFSVSTRPILGSTDAEAWERAHDIIDRIEDRLGDRAPRTPTNEASRRLLAVADRSEIFDRCLWTKPAQVTGAPGNSTALVGSPDTVAEALFEYYKLGASELLIRGFDPLPDAVAYGEELIPRVRRLVAAHER